MTGSTTGADRGVSDALHIKGETTDEISASAYVMRDCVDRVNYPGDVLEIVGTGGASTPSTFPLSPLWYAQQLALRSWRQPRSLQQVQHRRLPRPSG
ncbi:MAG: hypothetical protein ACLSG5_04220 [Oscillospiraceae bacterium]